MSGFLGVENSLTGRSWRGPDPEIRRRSEALAQDTGLPLPVTAILARRGVSAAEAPGFLAPTLRDTLPDPRGLKDMERAAARLLAALDKGEKIAVFADYDVDGAASAALLIDWLRHFGHAATLYVPDRITEGYGPNVAAMRALARDHSLIVTVDCGTAAPEAIAAANAEGAEVVVVDHHLGGETLPPALAVVNPNRQDETDAAPGYMCAAGVVFLLLVEAGRQLRAAGRAGPDLMAALDLVALATVADVAPLIGANRALVVQGLRVMARRARPGLTALADIARLDEARAPITWVMCWARASMPAGASGGPTWARGCCPPPTRTRPPRLPPDWTNSTSNAARSRTRCVPPPWTRPKPAVWMDRWSGPRVTAGIPALSASSLPA